jgi:outer membrane protein TolC
MNLPDGYHIEYGGEEESQNDTSGDMNWALIVSLILIFIVLLLQFRTFLDPLIVMTAFPLALPGAALGLFVTRNPFGFTAFVGIISLGGLVVRNSIILIDAIYERTKAGTPLVQAAMEAGERRLRPIFLTTMAAAVGVVPMILSGSSLWSPLASVIAFGLLVSMFFTLIVIPVLFVTVHGFKTKRAMSIAGTVVALALLAGMPIMSSAQTRTVTLEEAIRMAQQQNRTVRMARLKVTEAQAKLTQARADYFPRVTNESHALHMDDRQSLTIPQGSLGTSTQNQQIPNKDVALELGKQNIFISTTTAAQPLSQLFKIHAGVDAAHAEIAQARADAERAENEVEFNVKKLYYNLLALEQRRNAATLRIHAGEEKLAEARDAVAAGAALDVQVQEGTAEIAEAQNSLGALEDTEEDLKADLADLVGLPIESNFALLPPAEAPVSVVFDRADLTHRATTNNPEIASAQSMIAKASAGVRAARLEFVPDISLFAEHVYQSGVPLLPDNSATIGVRLEWTLSEFGKRTGQIKERKSQLEQAQENLQQTQDRVQIEIDKTLRKLRRSETALKAAQAAVSARTEAQRLSSDQVEAKTANASTLSETKAKLAESEAQLFEVRMEQAAEEAELEKLLGK